MILVLLIYYFYPFFLSLLNRFENKNLLKMGEGEEHWAITFLKILIRDCTKVTNPKYYKHSNEPCIFLFWGQKFILWARVYFYSTWVGICHFGLDLNLIGMRGDTFISSSFLDQILTAEFLPKISKKILEVKIDINWVNFTPCQAHWVL